MVELREALRLFQKPRAAPREEVRILGAVGPDGAAVGRAAGEVARKKLLDGHLHVEPRVAREVSDAEAARLAEHALDTEMAVENCPR